MKLNGIDYKEASGKLNYNDEGQYILDGFNISELFDKVYYDPNDNYMGFELFNNGKLICDEEGILYKDKNSKRIYVYYIDGISIEDLLWDSIDKNINIKIWRNIYGE